MSGSKPEAGIRGVTGRYKPSIQECWHFSAGESPLCSMWDGELNRFYLSIKGKNDSSPVDSMKGHSRPWELSQRWLRRNRAMDSDVNGTPWKSPCAVHASLYFRSIPKLFWLPKLSIAYLLLPSHYLSFIYIYIYIIKTGRFLASFSPQHHAFPGWEERKSERKSTLLLILTVPLSSPQKGDTRSLCSPWRGPSPTLPLIKHGPQGVSTVKQQERENTSR